MKRWKQQIAWMTAKQTIELQEDVWPAFQDDQVIVQVEEVGICGSDASFFETGTVGPDPLPFPVVLGHECAGTVVEVGRSVTHLRPGDRVCVEPGIPCGTCEFCRSGRYNLCQSVDFMAAPPDFHGCLKRYIAHPAQLVYKLPDHVSTVTGAMLEPLSVGYHAAQRGGVTMGKKIVILGSGCIGLMTLMSCRLMGATDITMVDLYDNRLTMARQLGAAETLNASQVDAVACYLGEHPLGADIVFETAGSGATTRQAGGLVKPGGTIVLVGNTHGDVPFDFFQVMNKEVDIRCVFRYANSYPVLLDAVSKGLVAPERVITNEYSFDQVQTAFLETISDKRNVVKSIIHVR